MVIVAQSVRAPDCGSGGRGFESRLSPKVLVLNFFEKDARKYLKFNNVLYLCALVLRIWTVLCNEVRHWSKTHIQVQWPHRLVVRSLPFQGSGTSSNLVGVTQSRFTIK